jgi:hypothetical protein
MSVGKEKQRIVQHTFVFFIEKEREEKKGREQEKEKVESKMRIQKI